MTKEITIQFAGGALSPTGANFLVEGFEKPFLVDCGLLQGEQMAESTNWEPFPYNPATIPFLFITHAHLDHIGKIPKLIHDGFRGTIVSTQATRDLAHLMLLDAGSILSASESGKQYNLAEIYSIKNIERSLELWKTVEYHEEFIVCEGLSVSSRDAGHVLGSASFVFEYKKQIFVFTGDLGNSPSPLLLDTEPLPEHTQYIVMESVYGDRNHEGRAGRREILKRVLNENHARKGVLMVPIFSLERTQEFLYEINELVESGQVPSMPIILDSPLAQKVTDIFQRYTHLLKPEVRKDIAGGDDIFMFPGFKETETSRDSRAIMRIQNPKVILAGAGMSTGGRILHHEKQYLSSKQNTILITGFQTPGSLGRAIEEGASSVLIHKEKVSVKARVELVKGYSGHKDSNGLVDFVRPCAGSLKKVFIAMGEMKSSLFLAQRLGDELAVSTSVPKPNEKITLTFSD